MLMLAEFIYLFIFMKPTVSLFFIFIFRRDRRRRRRRPLPPPPGRRKKRRECRGITLRAIRQNARGGARTRRLGGGGGETRNNIFTVFILRSSFPPATRQVVRV